MTYKLLIRKLYLEDEKFITSDHIRKYCKILKMDYNTVIRYLTHYRYLERIFKGIFYILSVEERKFNKFDISYRGAVAKALDIKGVKNWYFGLETAVKMNNLTHEFFVIDYIISDTIFRAKPIGIMGNKMKFVKLKPELFKFGINKGKFPYSDVEKTILDMIYLYKYKGFTDTMVKNKIIDLLEHSSKKKLINYAKKYNKSVRKFIAELT